jgi:YVTN family beta-propeller protein
MTYQSDLGHITRSFVAATIFCAVLGTAHPVAAQQPYHIVDRWKLGGEGGWDYSTADSAAHRLYLTRGSHVDVVDTQTGKLAGSITGLHGTHGVALDNAGKFGYISDGGGNAVVVFDRATLATLATIPAGTGPDSIIFEPATQTVWAFNGHSRDATVIDATTRKVVATIPLPGRPEYPAVDGKGLVFDNIEDKSEIIRIDAKTLKITAEWPTTGCEEPSGLAFDAAGSRLFPVCHNKVMGVIDANSGKVLATATIGSGPDAAGWDATHKLAFSSEGEGILSVVDAGAPGYPNIENLPTQRGSRTMAYDDATDRIYLAAAEFGPAPAPTAENTRPRPVMIPGSFMVIVVGR